MDPFYQTLLVSALTGVFALLTPFAVQWMQQRGGLRVKAAEGSVNNQIDERGRLYTRIEKLEEHYAQLNAQNDTLIVDNAKLNARVVMLEAQNASQATEIAKYEAIRLERDGLKEQLFLTQRRVTDLEREVGRLQEQLQGQQPTT